MTTTSATPTTSSTSATDSDVVPGRTTLLTLWVEFVGLFGLAGILVPWVSNELFNFVAFGSTVDPFDAAARDYVQFTFGIAGALTVALAVALWFLVRYPLRNGERWAFTAVEASILTWFLLDSGSSIATGFGRNAVLNTMLVALAVPGLILARPRAK